MPFHPGHHRAAPWQLFLAALVVAALLLLYVASFRSRRERELDAPSPAVPGAPVVPPAGAPAPPARPGA